MQRWWASARLGEEGSWSAEAAVKVGEAVVKPKMTEKNRRNLAVFILPHYEMFLMSIREIGRASMFVMVLCVGDFRW